MPETYAKRIHESIEGSELVIAEDSGHWLFVDATETFSTRVGDFLDRVEIDERRKRDFEMQGGSK
jgi:pimeloyl-ACP methyl ester carboxylesterase